MRVVLIYVCAEAKIRNAYMISRESHNMIKIIRFTHGILTRTTIGVFRKGKKMRTRKMVKGMSSHSPLYYLTSHEASNPQEGIRKSLPEKLRKMQTTTSPQEWRSTELIWKHKFRSNSWGTWTRRMRGGGERIVGWGWIKWKKDKGKKPLHAFLWEPVEKWNCRKPSNKNNAGGWCLFFFFSRHGSMYFGSR